MSRLCVDAGLPRSAGSWTGPAAITEYDEHGDRPGWTKRQDNSIGVAGWSTACAWRASSRSAPWPATWRAQGPGRRTALADRSGQVHWLHQLCGPLRAGRIGGEVRAVLRHVRLLRHLYGLLRSQLPGADHGGRKPDVSHRRRGAAVCRRKGGPAVLRVHDRRGICASAAANASKAVR